MTIKQCVTIDSPPESIYAALLTATQFSEFTGAPAEIAQAEGGKFRCFGGQISGHHIELIPNRKIVQAWRVSNWEEGLYSLVSFSLEESGDATIVQLVQRDYPRDARDHLDSGWHKMYWEPLRAYLSRAA